ERGVGLGISADWRTEDTFGNFYGYIVPQDEGEDVLSTGRRIDQDGDTRGMVEARNAWDMGDGWILRAQGGYVSDPAYMEAYETDRAETTEEITNRIILSRLTDQTSFHVEAKAQAND